MTITGFIFVFLALFISDVFWVKCVKSVNQEEPIKAGFWAIGIFLPTALGTVAYVYNPLLLIPACLGHFCGTAFTVWWDRKIGVDAAAKRMKDRLDKYVEFAKENEGREFR